MQPTHKQLLGLLSMLQCSDVNIVKTLKQRQNCRELDWSGVYNWLFKEYLRMRKTNELAATIMWQNAMVHVIKNPHIKSQRRKKK